MPSTSLRPAVPSVRALQLQLPVESSAGSARRAAPLLLVTTGHPTLHRHPGRLGEDVHPRLGRLVQPRHLSSIEKTAGAAIPWGADNDCFNSWRPAAFYDMCDRLKGLPGCLFVTVPDVVADSADTARVFEMWAPALERRGLPVALVAQDGLEHLTSWLERTWSRLDALFIGGSTAWKEGPHAAALAREAQARGKWVHWGRVNTERRMKLICATGAADCFDGSKWARWRDRYLNEGLDWLEDDSALYGSDHAPALQRAQTRYGRRLAAQHASEAAVLGRRAARRMLVPAGSQTPSQCRG